MIHFNAIITISLRIYQRLPCEQVLGERGGREREVPLPYVSSSFLPYLFSVFPRFLPFLVKKTVRAVGGTFIGIEKNRGGYTQHAKRKRHCNGKHKTTINHSVGSKRFRPVSEQSTRSESQMRREKWRIFSALVPFFPRPKLLCLSLLRNQTKKAGYAGYIDQGM